MHKLTVIIGHHYAHNRHVYNITVPFIPEPGDVLEYENQSGQFYSGTVKNRRIKTEWDNGEVVSKIYVYAE